MGRGKDLTNQRFGKLVATQKVCKYQKNNSWMWHCVCDCGNETIVQVCHLTSGNTKSCGCGVHKGKHRMSKSSEYTAWRKMRAKGTCPDSWSEFLVFVIEVGCKPSADHVLWRRDFTQNHGKGNTYWRHPDDTDAEQGSTNGYIDFATGTYRLPGTATVVGTRSTPSIQTEARV